MPKSSIKQLVYVNRPPLVKIPIDSNADKYKEELPRAYGPLLILQVTKYTVTVDENRSPNTTSIDHTTLVTGSFNHLRRFKASKTSF